MDLPSGYPRILVYAYQAANFGHLLKATILAQVDLFIDQFEVADNTAAVTEQLAALTPPDWRQTSPRR
ncbi:MAG: hypothetical protein ABSB19_06670 [Methylomonas sp.]|jgi:hypothetical protein